MKAKIHSLIFMAPHLIKDFLKLIEEIINTNSGHAIFSIKIID